MATKSGASGLVYSVVAIAIIVLIVSTVALPVIEDSQNELKTVRQNAGYTFSVADGSTTSVVMALTESTLTINGREYEPTENMIPMLSNSFFVQVKSGVFVVNVNDSYYITSQLTASNGVLSFVADSQDVSITFGTLYWFDNNGKFGYFTSGQIYVNSSSRIIMAIETAIANESLTPNVLYISGSFVGTISGMVQNTMRVDQGNLLSTSLSLQSERVDGQDDVYRIDLSSPSTFTISGTTEDGTYSTTTGNYCVIAPIEYYIVTESDYSMINLFNVLPIILFLVPVMLAVRMIQTRRN